MNLQVLKKNLENRMFKVSLFETANEAKEYLLREINGKTVAFGGSRTIDDMKLFEALKENNVVWSHSNKEQVEEYGADRVRESAMNTEVYLSSVNGISEEGTIINIDGVGNRIASTAHGHKKVYLLVGKNKLAKTFEEALWRARNIAGPKNAQRLGVKTPCALKGDKCYNCQSPERICRGFLITERAMLRQETEVVLINEDLGF